MVVVVVGGGGSWRRGGSRLRLVRSGHSGDVLHDEGVVGKVVVLDEIRILIEGVVIVEGLVEVLFDRGIVEILEVGGVQILGIRHVIQVVGHLCPSVLP